jgi:hypothetical protein
MKAHAGGSLVAGKDPDFFFDRDVHWGPKRGIFTFSWGNGNDFACFAHARF